MSGSEKELPKRAGVGECVESRNELQEGDCAACADAFSKASPSSDSHGAKGRIGSRVSAGHRIMVARRVTLSLVFVAVIASLAFDCGLGTPSTFGVGQFFLLCPLGGLEAMIADRSFIPVAAISMAVVCVLALLFGRAWCAWGCPAPVIR